MADIGGYGPIIIGTMWVETGITLLFVCLRIYTRVKINRTVGWDDHLIVISSVSEPEKKILGHRRTDSFKLMLIPYSTAVTLAALKGLGRHSAELTLDQFMDMLKLTVIGQT